MHCIGECEPVGFTEHANHRNNKCIYVHYLAKSCSYLFITGSHYAYTFTIHYCTICLLYCFFTTVYLSIIISACPHQKGFVRLWSLVAEVRWSSIKSDKVHVRVMGRWMSEANSRLWVLCERKSKMKILRNGHIRCCAFHQTYVSFKYEDVLENSWIMCILPQHTEQIVALKVERHENTNSLECQLIDSCTFHMLNF